MIYWNVWPRIHHKLFESEFGKRPTVVCRGAREFHFSLNLTKSVPTRLKLFSTSSDIHNFPRVFTLHFFSPTLLLILYYHPPMPCFDVFKIFSYNFQPSLSKTRPRPCDIFPSGFQLITVFWLLHRHYTTHYICPSHCVSYEPSSFTIQNFRFFLSLCQYQNNMKFVYSFFPT